MLISYFLKLIRVIRFRCVKIYTMCAIITFCNSRYYVALGLLKTGPSPWIYQLKTNYLNLHLPSKGLYFPFQKHRIQCFFNWPLAIEQRHTSLYKIFCRSRYSIRKISLRILMVFAKIQTQYSFGSTKILILNLFGPGMSNLIDSKIHISILQNPFSLFWLGTQTDPFRTILLGLRKAVSSHHTE